MAPNLPEGECKNELVDSAAEYLTAFSVVTGWLLYPYQISSLYLCWSNTMRVGMVVVSNPYYVLAEVLIQLISSILHHETILRLGNIQA